MDIVLASRNKHKIVEINTLLADVSKDIRVLSLDDIGHEGEIDENGTTFEENSMIKACAPVSFGYAGIADDSGLAVDALDGAPGVYSARYAGEPCDDKRNNNKLLEVMSELSEGERTAKFVSVVSVMFPKESPYHSFDEAKLKFGKAVVDPVTGARGFGCRGECPGKIIFEEKGSGGFGYDPLFMCDAYGRTFAEINSEEKNAISHRGEAMRKFVIDLAAILS
ncbi:MAG: non-canonical purine NTP pyrophosphatase [Clostridia bacterium]|nr:non-canonical purine NTP pyrophosphatase [Clostridia bacterium]